MPVVYCMPFKIIVHNKQRKMANRLNIKCEEKGEVAEMWRGLRTEGKRRRSSGGVVTYLVKNECCLVYTVQREEQKMHGERWQ